MTLLYSEPETFEESASSTVTVTHEVVHDLMIAAAPEAVFDALGYLVAPSGASSPLAPGSRHVLRFGDGEVTMRVMLTEGPEILQLECVDGPRDWIGTTVALRVEPVPHEITRVEGPVTMVRFWHGGWAYADGQLPRASFEWALRLDHIRRRLEAVHSDN